MRGLFRRIFPTRQLLLVASVIRVHTNYSSSSQSVQAENTRDQEERKWGGSYFADDVATRRIELPEGREKEVWPQHQGERFIENCSRRRSKS